MVRGNRMKKETLSFLGIATFALFAMGTSKKKAPEDSGISIDPLATATATATATSTHAPPKKTSGADKPDPAADYKNIEDMNLDGKKAIGKTALVRMRRSDTSDRRFTAHSCTDKGTGNYANLEFEADQAKLVRAMPQLLKNFGDDCPRVFFKITGQEPYIKRFKGKVLEIMDTEPEESGKAPDGADYGSLDDANFDGGKAKGKTLDIMARRGDTKDKKFYLYECNNPNGMLTVAFRPDQKDSVKLISSDYKDCTRVKLRLKSQDNWFKTHWSAELLEVK